MKITMRKATRFGGALIYRMLDAVFTNRFKICKMHEQNGTGHSVLYQADCVPKDHTVITHEIEDIYDLPAGSVVLDSIEPYKRAKSIPKHAPSAESLRKNARFIPVKSGDNEVIKDIARHADQVDIPRIDSSIKGQ